MAVTAGAPYLEFYQKTDSDEGNCAHDHAYVAINGLDEYTRGLCGTDSAWFRSVIDLSDYIGTTITLEFRVETDASVSSSWFVDDVAFYGGLCTVPGSRIDLRFRVDGYSFLFW